MAVAYRRQRIIEGLVRSECELTSASLLSNEQKHFREGQVADALEATTAQVRSPSIEHMRVKIAEC